LGEGEIFCYNCGEPTISAVEPKIREKPSDIVTCLVIGLFVLFGIPAVLFGIYLVCVGVGAVTSPNVRPGSQWISLAISAIPLAVFAALLFILIKVGLARQDE
jgi:hypothetical protein